MKTKTQASQPAPAITDENRARIVSALNGKSHNRCKVEADFRWNCVRLWHGPRDFRQVASDDLISQLAAKYGIE